MNIYKKNIYFKWNFTWIHKKIYVLGWILYEYKREQMYILGDILYEYIKEKKIGELLYEYIRGKIYF